MTTKRKLLAATVAFGISPVQEFTLEAIPVRPEAGLEPRYGRPVKRGGAVKADEEMSVSQQTTGNIGLFYVCYKLSRLGWNVLPTTRNARGIDVLIYSQHASRTRTVQVKTLSKASPVPLSNSLDHLIADFVVVGRHVNREPPECFILIPDEIRLLVHRGEKN